MSKGNNKGSGLHRKKDEWIAIAKGRDNRMREVRIVDPFACAPKMGDVGSAAYRRLMAR